MYHSSIFVDGYWEKNLGDDLFLYIVAKRYPQITFDILTTYDNYQVFEQITNIHLIKLKRTLGRKLLNSISRKIKYPLKGSIYHEVIQASRGLPLFLELGGSIFILPQNGKLDVNYTKRKIIRKLVNDYIVMGSNFGPFYSKKQLELYHQWFSSLTGISFRDKNSYDIFNDIDKVSYYPDIVFTLPIDTVGNISENYILFSIINTKKFGKDIDRNYTKFVKKQIEKEIYQGHKVVLMSFCVNDGDTDKAHEIVQHLDSVADKISIFEHSNIESSIRIIKQAKKIFATRYHAMILGWLFMKPTFVVSYSHKTEDVIKTYNQQQTYRKLENISEASQAKYVQIDNSKLSSLKEEAENHFKNIDRILNKYGQI